MYVTVYTVQYSEDQGKTWKHYQQTDTQAEADTLSKAMESHSTPGLYLFRVASKQVYETRPPAPMKPDCPWHPGGNVACAHCDSEPVLQGEQDDPLDPLCKDERADPEDLEEEDHPWGSFPTVHE